MNRNRSIGPGPSTCRPRFRLAAFAAALAFAPAVFAIDWSGVAEKEIPLFYPGQSSWEWALTQADHSGAGKFREGKNCAGCHDGEQKDIGAAIIKGDHKLEPKPITGKPGSAALFVSTARDAERLYFRLRWRPAPASGSRMSEHAAHITVMFDDGGLKESARAGCWASCHDDAIGMASAPEGSTIKKYIGASRPKLSRQGGGKEFKPQAELDALLAQNAYFEYWQALVDPGQPVVPVSGYVLETRQRHDPVAIDAQGEFVDGEWRVVLSRPLKAAGRAQKDLAAGKTYAVGFALHDDYSDHRYHFVSLEYILRLDGGDADFVAVAK